MSLCSCNPSARWIARAGRERRTLLGLGVDRRVLDRAGLLASLPNVCVATGTQRHSRSGSWLVNLVFPRRARARRWFGTRQRSAPPSGQRRPGVALRTSLN